VKLNIRPLFLAVEESFRVALEEIIKKPYHFRFKVVSFRSQIKLRPHLEGFNSNFLMSISDLFSWEYPTPTPGYNDLVVLPKIFVASD